MSHRLSRSRSIDDWGPPPRSQSTSLVRRLRSRWVALAAAAGILWWWAASASPLLDPVEDYYAKMSVVLKHSEAPQNSFKDQLSEDYNFVTGMGFGGTGNQFIAMMNLLYLAKHTARIAILPPVNPDKHFVAELANVSEIYDVARFVAESGVMAVQLSDLKRRRDPRNSLDSMNCWSLMELKSGSANAVRSWPVEFTVFTNFWAVPRFNKTSDKSAIVFSQVIRFLNDHSAQVAWLDEAQRDSLPQMPNKHPVERTANVKSGFDPNMRPRPTDDDQLMCLDSCFWLGFEPPAIDEDDDVDEEKRLSHKAMREGAAWKEIGRYLHYTPEVERIADNYLRSIFDVPASAPIPPFIAIHIRRTDFANFKGHGFTPLASYAAEVELVRRKLQEKLRQSRFFSRSSAENLPRLKKFDLPPSEYRVLVATDEPAGTEFWKEIEAMGWKTIDHEGMGTEERLGPWWPAKLDGEMLGRAQGLVGTEWSSYSMLAGLRVEYWRGGVVGTAKRKFEVGGAAPA